MPGCILIEKDPMTNKDFLKAYEENENVIEKNISLQPLSKIYKILTLSKNKKLNKMMNKILNTYYKISYYGRIDLRNAKESLPESLQNKLNEIIIKLQNNKDNKNKEEYFLDNLNNIEKEL